MNFKNIDLKTFWKSLPSLLNDNFNIVKSYIDVFYDPSIGTKGTIKASINTTGNIKGNEGNFKNLRVTGNSNISNSIISEGNLTINGLLLSQTWTSSDIKWTNTYLNNATIPRDASYSWEPSIGKYIDITEPYYKIKNDVSTYILNTNKKGQIVQFIFDTSNHTLSSPFSIRLDPSNNKVNITATDSSLAWLSLISINADNSTNNAIWKMYQWNGNFTVS